MTMNSDDIKQLIDPSELDNPLLRAMWMAAHDNWEGAHNIAQDVDTPDGSRVHGYLHWLEGDLWNADYWYRHAGITRPDTTLEEEWHNITKELLRS